MLHSSFPLSLVIFVLPVHLTIAMSIIVCEITYVMVPTRPSKHSLAMFLIILVLSLIPNMSLLQIIPSQLYSIPMADTIPKCSYFHFYFQNTSIFLPISPNICTLPLHISIAVLPVVHISICEVLHTMTMFQGILETPSVFALIVNVYTMTIYFPKSPFPLIKWIVQFPNTMSMSQSIHPLPFVRLILSPLNTLSLRFPILILALKICAIIELFSTKTMFSIILPKSLTMSALHQHQPFQSFNLNTLPMFLSIHHLTIKCPICIILFSIICQCLECVYLCSRYVLLEY